MKKPHRELFQCLAQGRQLLNSYEIAGEDKDGILLAGCGSQVGELAFKHFCVWVFQCNQVHSFSSWSEQSPECIKYGYMMDQTAQTWNCIWHVAKFSSLMYSRRKEETDEIPTSEDKAATRGFGVYKLPQTEQLLRT